MRLQIVDPNINFECNSCTRCCDQPWRTLIEPDKIERLDGVNWAAEFPEMSGRELYRKARLGKKTVYELGKGEGTRCVFLNHDGLCRIHMRLGYDAKPQMCQQFPYFSALAWDADYVSANFGCKAVQESSGPPAIHQCEQIAATVPLHDQPAHTDAPFMLAPATFIPQSDAHALLDRLGELLVSDDASNSAAVDGTRTIMQRLADALATLQNALQTDSTRFGEALACGALDADVDPDQYQPFESAADAPMPSRFLFAATLFPDTLPPDAAENMGFFKRLALVPKLMALTQMRGAYASRLLGRNVKLGPLLDRAADVALTPDATALLGRYLRSRLWQQFPGGTHLPLLSALHQHILDINAVVFFALAESGDGGTTVLDEPIIQRALMHVEFHLSNQPRLHTQVLQKYLKGSLGNPGLAWASLRMLRLETAAVPAAR